MKSLAKSTFYEALGTAFLLAAIVGSGIAAERLSGGNVAPPFSAIALRPARR